MYEGSQFNLYRYPTCLILQVLGTKKGKIWIYDPRTQKADLAISSNHSGQISEMALYSQNMQLSPFIVSLDSQGGLFSWNIFEKKLAYKFTGNDSSKVL